MTERRARKPRTFTFADRQRFTRAAEHYVQDCFRRQKVIQAQGFAETVEVTPQYASWFGSRVLGMPLLDWFRARQVDYAMKLLRRNALHIHEIAVLTGFGSVRAFQRAFLKRTGTTPSAFRELKK
ncbi:MAG TPA: helix-turn-helix domain-containing protein [Thermoanaerobaculia bacterium]|nr:helix-turn-helix domain-containing protein [Thermoanaerobaculia bacterium]